MNIIKLAVRNPAATLVAAMLVLGFGALAIYRLPIQLLPELSPPRIFIFTGWRAAAPEEIEEQIIQGQERVLANIQGVTSMVSSIARDQGYIELNFEIGWDMQQGLIDVITNLNQAPPLPADADEPIVRAGAGTTGSNAAATLQLFRADDLDSDVSAYEDLVTTLIEPRLARVPGVAEVNLQSRREREIAVNIDPHRLAGMGVSIDDVSRALRRATNVSGGFADVGRRQYTVRIAGSFGIDQLGNLVVGWRNAQPVYLRDVAAVEAGFMKRNSFSRRNGHPSYYIRLNRSNGANTVELLDSLKEVIAELNEGPLAAEGLTLELSFDSSLHIRRAIALVQSNLLLGLLLSSVVLFLFLRVMRATLVIALSIPLSLMGAFLALQFTGHSLNVISLAGLAFAVGLSMDASIVVQENIMRLGQQGMGRRDAAEAGAGEVAPALLSSTLTTVAIFVPIIFLEGLEGQLFKDLAITLSAAVLMSLLVSLTVLPMATAHAALTEVPADPLQRFWLRLADWIDQHTLTDRARMRWVLSILGFSALVVVLLLPKVDFLPKADVDAVESYLDLPPGTSLDTIESEVFGEIERRLQPYYSGEREPRVRGYNVGVGPGYGTVFLYPAEPEGTDPLIRIMREEILAGLPDVGPFVRRASMIQVDDGGRSIAIDIRGADLETLMRVASAGMEQVMGMWETGSAYAQPALTMDQPELRIVPDDKRLGLAGLDRMMLADAVRALTDGLYAGEYFDGNRRYDMLVHGPGWSTPEELGSTPIATPLAGVQAIGELASIEYTVGPVQLQRVDGLRTVTINVLPPEHVTLEEAIERLRAELDPALQAMLPPGASIAYRGSADRLQEAVSKMLVNFAIASLILFAIMAAVFRSAWDSLLVLLVMPPAVAGGVMALKAFNLFTYQSLDMLTMVGFIILLGLVVNNAILLVDQTRSREREGATRRQAIHDAVLTRARPVFMSTLTSIFGMLPLMLMPGVGSEIYRGLAAVIVGGMISSGALTLLLMPSLLGMGAARAPSLPDAAAEAANVPGGQM
ncbi:MAG: acriflavine resistance protein B [Haliea sp.]|uniref:efflux RND transporter permease subunit n=1 Tax=Haliea sp. TaxID=1932666 RepID=UPI000C52BA7C|nr:efflux RND transporter permease subunit [Haliea sp.]MBM70423.1 acriflavine resistance protein B [Haliea sp.]